MPCLHQGLDAFVEHLLELERVISESKLLRPVFILGNFNAHLGALGGQRGVDNTNTQGVLLYEMLGTCDLSVLFLACIASGAPDTYHCGEVDTTVDHICGDLCAASLAHSCHTHAMEDLNTSDHLTLSLEFMYTPCVCDTELTSADARQPRVDLDRARKDGDIDVFVAEVRNRLQPFLNSNFSNIEQINQ